MGPREKHNLENVPDNTKKEKGNRQQHRKIMLRTVRMAKEFLSLIQIMEDLNNEISFNIPFTNCTRKIMKS